MGLSLSPWELQVPGGPARNGLRDYSGLGGAIAFALGIAGSRRPGAERTTRDYSKNAGLRRDWPHVAQCCRTIAARLAARLPYDYPKTIGDSRHGWRVALVRRLLPLGVPWPLLLPLPLPTGAARLDVIPAVWVL